MHCLLTGNYLKRTSAMEDRCDCPLVLRVVGCLPYRDGVREPAKVEAGVAQAPREETAESWGCGWSRVKRYGDLTSGTGALIGAEMGPRAGDLTEMVKASAEGSESGLCRR